MKKGRARIFVKPVKKGLSRKKYKRARMAHSIAVRNSRRGAITRARKRNYNANNSGCFEEFIVLIFVIYFLTKLVSYDKYQKGIKS